MIPAMGKLDRKVACVLVAVLVLVSPLATQPCVAQQRTARIGVLDPGHPAVRGPLIEAFRQGLRERGYEEGRNVVVETRYAEGRLERLPELAADLVRLKVDVIVAAGTPAIHAARRAAPTIPIIMSTVGDPVAEGFVASFAKPGGNITGRTMQGPELSAKRLQMLKEAAPRVSRVAILWDPSIVHEIHGFKEAQAAAPSLGVVLLSVPVKTPDELEQAFAGMVRDGANGLFVFTNSLTNNYGKRIATLAIKHRLPGVVGIREVAEVGGLLSYGPVQADNFFRAAFFVDKVLKGAKPSDLPVEQPTKFELVINLQTAKVLGLTMPQTLLLRADQVIP